MKIILISPPADLAEEQEVVHALLEEGLDYFHVRKPDHSLPQLENYLRAVKPSFYRRLSIHSHHSLIGKYNLGGIHFPEKLKDEPEVKEVIQSARKKNIRVSSSAHSLGQVNRIRFDYIFLSPVFDSISKLNYPAAIDLEKFTAMRNEGLIKSSKIIALGGVDYDKIDRIVEAEFGGLALSGAIWAGFENDKSISRCVDKFIMIKNKLKELQKV